MNPIVTFYRYYHQKKRFEYEVDVYNDWAVFAVMEGEFQYQIDNQKGTALFGDIVICPPQTPFHRKTDKPISFHYIHFRWDTGSYMPKLGVKLTIWDKERLISNYARLEKTNSVVNGKVEEWRDHLFWDILQMWKIEQEIPELFMKHETNDAVMKRVYQELAGSYHASIRLDDLAASYGLSPVQFTRRFQRAYKVRPSEYLMSLRLQKAQALLLSTKLTNDEIAGECGYSDGYYFSRIFTRKMKMSPKEFRKTHRV